MTAERLWKFPLVALAVSAREVGFVAAPSPMRIDVARSWMVRRITPGSRRQFIERRVHQAVAKFDPETVLVTHGTQWVLDDRTRSTCLTAAKRLGLDITFLDLSDASNVIGCEQKLRATAQRVLEWFPEFEPRLRPALVDRPEPDAVRDARPLLSALAVAHAASVAHVLKFG